jgi:circadian clock protein KaiC
MKGAHAMRLDSDRPTNDQASLARTGIEGLDYVLNGGLARNRLYLVEGVPGAGKTTLALQFLLAGVQQGEPTLYVSLSETREELVAGARSHEWSLDGIEIHEILATEGDLEPSEQYTIFDPTEVEFAGAIKPILAEVERLKPARIVIDSLSELRLLAATPLRYRRQILALKQYFAGRGSTVLVLDDLTAIDRDLQVQSIAHGVILLEHLNPEYGSERRRLRVLKYRGQEYHGGFHDYAIRRGGLTVFPRLVAADHRTVGERARLSSGLAELDALLGGGLERGTSALIVGAPGTGKSSLAMQFAAAAAARGQASALFIFDESIPTLLSRAAGLGLNLQPHVDAGLIRLQTVDPAELSPGEFVVVIRNAVQDHHAKIVVIDSLNGYLNAMPAEHYLIVQLHELLTYLGQSGVATLLIGAQHGLIGSSMQSPIDASYLADAIVSLRYFEAAGEVRQAIAVVKKRGGEHERSIREFHLEPGGIRVGQSLRQFRGILTGVPVLEIAKDSPSACPPT